MENGIHESHLRKPMVFQLTLLSFYWEMERTEKSGACVVVNLNDSTEALNNILMAYKKNRAKGELHCGECFLLK